MAACHLLSKTQFHDSLGDKGFYLPLFKSFRILPEHQITPGKHIPDEEHEVKQNQMG